jgi:opine dehydrogenase
MDQHIAVLGAGNIAHALAAHMALLGHKIRLYSPFESEAASLRERGGIQLSGALEGFGPLSMVSTDIREVVPGARVVLVVTPAFAHRYMAEACSSCLAKDQPVLLHPGTFGSSMEFAQHAHGHSLVAESDASLYIARISSPGAVKILSIKSGIRVAAFPSRNTVEVIDRLTSVFPGSIAQAETVIETGLNNSQAIIHCPTVLLNLARVETGEEWIFWRGISPGVANFIETLDAERVALGRALTAKTESLREFQERAYGLSGLPILEMLHNVFSRGGGAKGPSDRNHRWIFEDVPFSLVPWASVGRQLGVRMPVMESLINLFSATYRQDMSALGRTAETMGLSGLSAARIIELSREGK